MAKRATATDAIGKAVESAPTPPTQGTGHLHSPIFRLPPELRNEIHAYVLDDDRIPYLSTIPFRHSHDTYYLQCNKALTLVSRTLRLETLALYYSANRHFLNSHTDNNNTASLSIRSCDWLASLDDSVVSSLRVLGFYYSCSRCSCRFSFEMDLREKAGWVTRVWIDSHCSRFNRGRGHHFPRPARAVISEMVERAFGNGGRVVVTAARTEELIGALPEVVLGKSDS